MEIRRTAEKLISRAREDTVHNRRIAAKRLRDKSILAKLFLDIGVRFRERPGGYTRVLKIGPRPSDGAEMVVLELVERGTSGLDRKKRVSESSRSEESD